jgi:hypothetical protein
VSRANLAQHIEDLRIGVGEGLSAGMVKIAFLGAGGGLMTYRVPFHLGSLYRDSDEDDRWKKMIRTCFGIG